MKAETKTKNELVDLLQIHRYLAKEASAEEKKELEQWLEQSKANRELFGSYKKIYQVEIKKTHNFDIEAALSKFKGVMNEGTQSTSGITYRKTGYGYVKRKRSGVWLKAAAVLIVGLCLSVYAITSSGIFGQEDEQIVEAETGLIIETKAGEQKSLRMNDGTRIRMNALSRAHVLPGYGSEQRRIVLEGEAFFDVAGNPELEFIVETSAARISVLGTSFGVRAWNERDESIVAVETGRVSVRSSRPEIEEETILTPGEFSQIRLGEAPGPAMQENIERFTGWTNQMFVFEETPLRDVLHQLELHFNVSITVNDSTSIEDPVTARYEGESLDQILRYTSITHEIEFDVQPKNQ